MKQRARPLESIVDEQVRKWKLHPRDRGPATRRPVVTISRETGSRGRIIATRVAERLDFQLYSSNIIDEVAHRSGISANVVRSLDEEGLDFVGNLLATFRGSKGMTSNEYFHHLVEIIGTIASHGRAVILGRGANHIVPPEMDFRVRVVGPLEQRIARHAEEFDLPAERARERIETRDQRRARFIQRHFRADIHDPHHYDMVLNDQKLPLDRAVDAIVSCVIDD